MTGTSGDTGLDFTRPSTARMYNYYLGGRTWFDVDRAAAEAVLNTAPDAGAVARENFLFAGRAAAWAATTYGIGQVLDIGAGIVGDVPLPSVEDQVHQARPGAVVVGCDNDPVVLAHARSMRAGYKRVLRGDVRDLDALFGNPELNKVLNVQDQAVVVLAAVLHFIEDPAAVMGGLRDRLAPGSVVVLSHATRTGTSEARVGGMTKAYATASSPIIFREEEAIAALADGWDLLPPGLVDVQLWSPDGSYQEELYESVRVVGMVVRLPDLPEGPQHASGGAQ